MTERKPGSCSIVLHTECMFRCRMCRMWRSGVRDGEKVPDALWKKTIGELARFLERGRELVFSGGEPLLRPSVLELAGYASSLGLKTIMPTNGYCIDEPVARALGSSGMSEVFISLDSCDPAVHDYLRGVQGAHAGVMRACENLRRFAPRTRVGIICVISEVNREDVTALARWVRDSGFLTGVYFQAVAQPFYAEVDGAWRDSAEYGELWPKDPEAMARTLDELIRLKREGFPVHNMPQQIEMFKRYFRQPQMRVRGGQCYLGDNVVNIGPSGDVSICCFMEPVGNIMREGIGDIWGSAQAQRIRARMAACTANCNNLVNCFFEEDKEGSDAAER